MRTFTIDAENNISVHAGIPVGTESKTHFASQTELAQLTAAWPLRRLVETWNSLAGVAPFSDLRPVHKFNDRPSAVARLWKALDRLTPLVVQPARESAPEEPSATRSGAKDKPSHTAPRRAKLPAGGTRQNSKKAEVLDRMRRPEGVSLREIRELTGWQAHTVRGFVSILASRGGHSIESAQADSGERIYRLTQ